MKCPKCGYLGYEPVDRCRHCGYQFALTPAAEDSELPLNDRDTTEHGWPSDVDLTITERPVASPDPDLADAPILADRRRTPGHGLANDLPLFADTHRDGIVETRSVTPRPPIAVRRAAVEPRRRPDETPGGHLDLEAETRDEPDVTPEPARRVTRPAREALRVTGEPTEDSFEPAGLSARLLAVAIDMTILGLVDVAVIHFTLQICGIAWKDLSVLPVGPLAAFLVVQNGGYLVMFTAGGQTLGKLMAGIRVIAAPPASSLDVGRSLVRTLVWIVLAIPVGLGFLTALFDDDRRGLHDRFAGTRVIRVSA